MSATTRNMTDEQKLQLLCFLELALNTPSSVADVFLRWHPHCDSVSIEINDGGWREGVEPHFTRCVYYGSDFKGTPNDPAIAINDATAHITALAK